MKTYAESRRLIATATEILAGKPVSYRRVLSEKDQRIALQFARHFAGRTAAELDAAFYEARDRWFVRRLELSPEYEEARKELSQSLVSRSRKRVGRTPALSRKP
ncbi:MAG TPA: hypothetical protein VI911_00300 [Patescibacteria group bacterium]|nr:hypothetical protein [Patescibacteria group bacterium]